MDPSRTASHQAEQPAAGGEAPITFGVQGEVVDADGRPFETASIGAWVLDAAAGPVPEIGVVTNAQGKYFWPLRPGRYRLTVFVNGEERATRDVEVPPQGSVTVRFELPAK